MPQLYDIVLIGDFRFPGGTSSAIAEEIKANAATGYRTALIHIEASILRRPRPINPRIRRLIDDGLADLRDPDRAIEARLAEVHNPYCLVDLPWPPLRVRAETRLLIAHHPPFDADEAPFYDAGLVDLHAAELLGETVAWAPVGPKVRAQLRRLDRVPAVIERDWYNVIEPAAWQVRRRRAARALPVVGRHSRPDPLKWPDTGEQILEAYPDDPRLRVRVLGSAPFLVERLGYVPRNWELLPFAAECPRAFLGSLDFFVYFHHSRWVEAFGVTIAEALAAGAIAVLPSDFDELFGEAAVCVERERVRDVVLGLYADPRARRRQAAAGRALIEDRFSHAAHRARLRRLIGPPAPSTTATGSPPRRVARARPQRVLTLSSNGVGMGHLTRLMAIARRLPAGFEAVFVTMSQALGILREHGYRAEHVPFHRYLGADINDWNRHFRAELNEMIAFYDPRVVVADLNVPYGGVIDCASDNPDRWFVWCRRPMWRPGVGRTFIEREPAFDLVLEPGELADAFDRGLTTRSRDRTRTVAPIRMLDRTDMLPREVARRELGLEPDRPALIFLLGSGNNFDYSTVRRLALDHLAKRDDVQVVVADWLISDSPPDLPDGVRRIQRFPLARWFGAFDAAVSAVGYNSFHELLFAGLPTLFIPNENPQQDDQLARARWAARHGLGECLRVDEWYGLKPALDRLLDPAAQAAIRSACAGLDPLNGAVEASQAVVELAHIRRADRPRD